MEYKPKPKGVKKILAEIENGATDFEQIATNTGYKLSTVKQYLSEFAPSIRQEMKGKRVYSISRKTQQIIAELKAGKRRKLIEEEYKVTRQRISFIKRKYIDGV